MDHKKIWKDIFEEFKNSNWDILGYNFVEGDDGHKYDLGQWCDKCAIDYLDMGEELVSNLVYDLDPKDADINLIPKVLGSLVYDGYCENWELNC